MKILQTLLLWLFFALPLLAQEELVRSYIPDNLPMAPEPNEFAKYVEIPVSKYTGVPEINIPLHNVQAGDLQLPINLSYHSNGIGVTQEATWAGLGWTLNAGGIITRSIHDLPDEMDFAGWLANGAFPYNPSDVLPDQTLEDLTSQPCMIPIDKQPDVFYFNFGKYKGKFVFDDQGKAQIIPKQNLKITYATSPDIFSCYYGGYSFSSLSSFTITTPDGDSYTFAQRQYTVSHTESWKYIIDAFAHQIQDNVYVGSWYLTQVEDADHQNEISLSYTTSNFLFTMNRTNQSYPPQGVPATLAISSEYSGLHYSSQLTQNVQLQSIISFNRSIHSVSSAGGPVVSYSYEPVEQIDFIADLQRQDVVSAPSVNNSLAAALSRINIYNRMDAQTLLKSYRFNYDYFESPNCTSAPDLFYFEQAYPGYEFFGDLELNKPTNYQCKRLRLLGVQEADANNVLLPPHSFSYNSTDLLPPKTSPQKDFWGFYNGKGPIYHTATSSDIPTIYVYPDDDVANKGLYEVIPRTTYNGTQYILPGADRTVDPIKAKAGLLTGITYPTGGSTNFEYESHSFMYNGDIIWGGGVRVSSITIQNPADPSANAATNFAYGSNGTITSMPIFSYVSSPYALFIDATSDFSSNTFAYYDTHTMRQSENLAPQNLTMGSHVGYKEVSVSRPNNGKTIYKFSTPALYQEENDCYVGGYCHYQITRSHFYTQHPNYANHTDIDQIGGNKNTFPFAPNPDYDWMRGDLTEETTYDQSNKIVYQKKYTYQISDFDIDRVQGLSIKKIKNYAGSMGYSSNGSVIFAPVYWYDDYLYRYSVYTYTSAFKYLAHEEETVYDQNGTTNLSNTTDYAYDMHGLFLPTSITKTYANGDVYQTNLTYPANYMGCATLADALANSCGPPPAMQNDAKAIWTMAQRNQLTPVIEKRVLKNNQLIAATYTRYKDFDMKGIKPYQKYALETASPLTQAPIFSLNYSTGYLQIVGTNSDKYKLKITFSYNDFGHLQSYTIPYSGNTHSFAWLSRIVSDDFMGNNHVIEYHKLSSHTISSNNNSLPVMTTTYAYDNAFKKLSRITDPNERYTNYYYDTFGRLSMVGYKGNASYDGLDGEFEEVRQQIGYHYANQTDNAASILMGISPSNDRNYICRVDEGSLMSVKYFDDLGRPLQYIGIRQGQDNDDNIANNPDLITPVAYDALGREAVQYLPYTSTTDIGKYRPTATTAQAAFYNNGTSNGVVTIATADNAYSEVGFDNSPLNRIVRKAEPGADWKMTNTPTPDHTTRTAYKLLAAPAPFNLYLYGIENTDENGRITKTYTDLLNRPLIEINADNVVFRFG